MYFTPSHNFHHSTHESSLAGACVAFCLTQWGNLFCAAQATEKNGFQSAAHGPSYVKEHRRKPECSDRTHTSMGRTCKLREESRAVDSSQEASCCEATVLTAAPLCCQTKKYYIKSISEKQCGQCVYCFIFHLTVISF